MVDMGLLLLLQAQGTDYVTETDNLKERQILHIVKQQLNRF